MSLPVSTIGGMLDNISDTLGKFGVSSESSGESIEEISNIIGERGIWCGVWNRSQIHQRRIGVVDGSSGGNDSRLGS